MYIITLTYLHDEFYLLEKDVLFFADTLDNAKKCVLEKTKEYKENGKYLANEFEAIEIYKIEINKELNYDNFVEGYKLEFKWGLGENEKLIDVVELTSKYSLEQE